MNNKRRPKLKPGDVCVISKGGKKRLWQSHNDILIVIEVGPEIYKPTRVSRAQYKISRQVDDGMCGVVVARKIKTNKGYRWWKTRMQRRNLYLVKSA